MPDSYTQLYTHIVFAVYGFKPFLKDKTETEIHGQLEKIIEQQGHQVLIINGTADHVHILIKQSPAHAISDLVREIKRQSSYFINHHLFDKPNFHWQGGYSAFSVTRSQVNTVYKFIEKQKEYHQDKNYKEEYLAMNEIEEEDFDDSIFKYKFQ